MKATFCKMPNSWNIQTTPHQNKFSKRQRSSKKWKSKYRRSVSNIIAMNGSYIVFCEKSNTRHILTTTKHQNKFWKCSEGRGSGKANWMFLEGSLVSGGLGQNYLLPVIGTSIKLVTYTSCRNFAAHDFRLATMQTDWATQHSCDIQDTDCP